MFGKRRLSALAAVVALAAVAGALGGAVATSGFSHFVASDARERQQRALEASVARIDSDILALKASIEHSAKLGISEFSKTSDRLGRVEKAQAEPAAKLAEAQRGRRQAPRRGRGCSGAGCSSADRGEGNHRLDRAAGRGSARCHAQGRGGEAADRGRLGVA